MGGIVWGFESGLTIGLLILGGLIVLLAQLKISASYSKYRRIQNKQQLSGSEVARLILDANGLEDIYIVETRGQLTDHYDPSRKVIRLSKDIFHGTSIAAVAVAAHEVGHAIQDKEQYSFMRIRSFFVPIVNLITYLGYFAMLFSVFIGIVGWLKVGIVMILATLLFQLITLPVEFDASKRARNQLTNLELIHEEETREVKAMLGAAAMTYVASFISTILNLLRLIIMFQDQDD